MKKARVVTDLDMDRISVLTDKIDTLDMLKDEVEFRMIGLGVESVKIRDVPALSYSLIVPGLYQSALIENEDIQILDDLGINVVIDCNTEAEGGFDPYDPSLISYLFWPIEDCATLPDLDELKAVAMFGLAYWKKGLKVLTHCAAGLNRSGLVNGRILVASGMSGINVVNLIQQQRPGALNNQVFANYLKSL